MASKQTKRDEGPPLPTDVMAERLFSLNSEMARLVRAMDRSRTRSAPLSSGHRARARRSARSP